MNPPQVTNGPLGFQKEFKIGALSTLVTLGTWGGWRLYKGLLGIRQVVCQTSSSWSCLSIPSDPAGEACYRSYLLKGATWWDPGRKPFLWHPIGDQIGLDPASKALKTWLCFRAGGQNVCRKLQIYWNICVILALIVVFVSVVISAANYLYILYFCGICPGFVLF